MQTHTTRTQEHTHLVTVNFTYSMATETTQGSVRRKVTRTAGRGRSAATGVSVAVNDRGPGGVSSGSGTFLSLWRLISLLRTVVYSRLLRPSHSSNASSRVERCARLRETCACAAVFRGNPRNCAITRKIALFRARIACLPRGAIIRNLAVYRAISI